MNNYTIFISWVLTTAYCFLYFGIFSVRRYGLFIIDDDQVGYVFSWRGLKLIVMGLMVLQARCSYARPSPELTQTLHLNRMQRASCSVSLLLARSTASC